MKILGIESASLVASVALVENGQLLGEWTLNMKKTHSQTLLPMLDQMMKMLETDISEVDAIAVSGGPGSFTGLRIGAATAKGIGLAVDKPLIHVPTMDAMAYGIWGTEALICPMLDARRGRVYTGMYKHRDGFQVVREAELTDIRELARLLNERGERALFLGDGTGAAAPVFAETLRIDYQYAPVPLNRQRGASVAALGERYLEEGRTVSAADFVPDYLRKSQAERELELAAQQGELDKLAAGIVVKENE